MKTLTIFENREPIFQCYLYEKDNRLYYEIIKDGGSYKNVIDELIRGEYYKLKKDPYTNSYIKIPIKICNIKQLIDFFKKHFFDIEIE